MFFLEEPLAFNDLLAIYLSSIPSSTIVKKLAGYNLALDIKKNYALAINSYQSFYVVHNEIAWLASARMLKK